LKPTDDGASAEVTPHELRDVDIRSEMRGYSKDAVNDLLERAASTIEALQARVDVAEAKELELRRRLDG
jgi:DivIVA domain-containing protein